MVSTNKLLGYAATALAVLTAMLSFTMLLSRFNGSVDREFPILLSEYFEVNPARQRAIIEVNQNAIVTDTSELFRSTWNQLAPLNVLISMSKEELNGLLTATEGATPQTPQSQQQAGLIKLILKENPDAGPIKEGYDVYNEGLQNVFKAVAPTFVFDAENRDLVQQYDALEATLGFFEAYTSPNVDAAKKNALPRAAATAVVTKQLETADGRFEAIRIQTRTAVGSSCVAILSFGIVLTILLVGKKTMAVVVLNLVGAIAGIVFLIMIQLNKDEQDKLLVSGGGEPREGNPGPAVFGAGFALGAGLIGAVVSFLWIRTAGKGNGYGSDESDNIIMDEVKSEEAEKAEI